MAPLLSAYALVSLEELSTYLSLGGNSEDAEVERIANRVSSEIESFLGRQIVSRGTLTEYHSPGCDTYEIVTLERPIIAVSAVHEDVGVPRTYGAGSALTADYDFHVVKPRGVIRRIQGLGLPLRWMGGLRTVRVQYTAGYASRDVVPDRIKSVALAYAGLIWREHTRRDWGISGAADSGGNYTRFAAPQLTLEMKSALADERRMWTPTGERDS